MEVIEQLIKHIEKQLQLKNIVIGTLATSSSSVCVRPTPSNANQKRLDGTRLGVNSFQILVKDKSQKVAYSTTCDVSELIDRLENNELKGDTFTLVKGETYVQANFVEKTEHDEYIYTTLINLEIEKGL